MGHGQNDAIAFKLREKFNPFGVMVSGEWGMQIVWVTMTTQSYKIQNNNNSTSINPLSVDLVFRSFASRQTNNDNSNTIHRHE